MSPQLGEVIVPPPPLGFGVVREGSSEEQYEEHRYETTAPAST